MLLDLLGLIFATVTSAWPWRGQEDLRAAPAGWMSTTQQPARPASRNRNSPTKPAILLVLFLVVHCSALAQQTIRGAYDLTAYRPQHGVGYDDPFARTAVPETFEEDKGRGPGIRVNSTGERDPAGEDDLIEVVVTRPSANATVVLERSNSNLSVWTTRTKHARTEVAFTNNRSTRLDLAFGQATEITLWVEWTGVAPALPALSLRARESDVVVDRIVFHAFTGLVVALGGEDQVPRPDVDPNHGTYRVATALYEKGWDVFMRDEDEVAGDGSGPIYEEVVNAIQSRSVRELAIFGYSRGGGSTYDLCNRLYVNRDNIGDFSINFTSYVDAIENPIWQNYSLNSSPERRKPPATRFHANQYQTKDWQLLELEGRAVDGSEPPPNGLDVTTQAWGSDATHFNIDDLYEVRKFIYDNLTERVSR